MAPNVPPPVLRGDRCRCVNCGEYFNSTHAFVKHRTGPFGRMPGRRCLSAEEMEGKGMSKRAHFWISRARENVPNPAADGGQEQ